MYIIVSEQDVTSDAVILYSQFFLAIKHPEAKNPTSKARFVILGDKDPDKERVGNEAPTTLRSSLRIILSVAKKYDFNLWSRDVSQAFVQAHDNLKRDVYIRSLRSESVLQTLGAPANPFLRQLDLSLD